MKKFIALLITGGLSLMLALPAVADVTPSNVWTDFYGAATTYNGQAIPPGSIIDAYDPDGVHCGTKVVETDGLYKFMPVYGDEVQTPEDEGAQEGDYLVFYINGRLAVPEGPDDPIWIGQGGRVELDLSASAQVGMEPVTDIATYVVQPGDTIRLSAMVRNTGEGIDFYTVSATTTHGWIIKPMMGFVYALPGEAAVVEFDVLVPVALFDEFDEFIDYRITSGADENVFLDNQATLQVRMPTDVGDDDKSLLPNIYQLHQNYPNPFNPATTISFDLPSKADVRLEVFDLLGRSLHHVEMPNLEAGNHSVDFDGTDFSSGIYFYRLTADDFSDMKKMVLLK